MRLAWVPRWGVSADAPYLDIVYKMVRYKDKNIQKRSSGKINLPGEKQVFRQTDEKSRFAGDTIGLKSEAITDNMMALLEIVMENGRIIAFFPPLDEIRNSFARNVSVLDEAYKTGERAYPVTISRLLTEMES